MQMIQSRQGEIDIEQGGGKQVSVQQYFCHVTFPYLYRLFLPRFIFLHKKMLVIYRIEYLSY